MTKPKTVSLPTKLWDELDEYAKETATAGERPNRSRAIRRLLWWALREKRDDKGEWENEGGGDNV